MLNNFGMRPAFAATGAKGSAQADRSAFSPVYSEADDYNAFGSTPERPTSAPKNPPKKAPRPAKPPKAKAPVPVKPILIACAIVVAVILLIVLAVAIFSAPEKEISLENNAYFVFADAEGKNHVVSNGDIIRQTFDGEISIVPAKDYSFAYIFESVVGEDGAGVRMYVLKGKSLKQIEAFADSVPTVLAAFEPGIVYEQNSRYYYYSADDHAPITANPSADNFVISDDASIVVYTEESKKEEGNTELKYFKNGGSKPVGPYNFTPVGLSNDGKYVFGTSASGNLYYLEITKKADNTTKAKQISSAKNGVFKAITGMNIDGKEIVFCTDSSKGTVSYLYSMGSTEPTEIGTGIFTPISADRNVVCQTSFVNSYFECVQTTFDEEGDSQSAVATYFFDKSAGARKMADTVGQFSPDKKYFYYVDETETLIRIPLDSKVFVKDAETVQNEVSDFAVIEKGNVYMMLDDQDKGFIYFWDSSTKKSNRITYNADLDSMQLCANSIYFSETGDEGVTIYVSTNGSSKEVASFKNGIPTATPTIAMGADESAYAYFTEESGNVKLYFTENGKKFSFVAESCTILGADDNAPSATLPESDAADEEEEEEEEE